MKENDKNIVQDVGYTKKWDVGNKKKQIYGVFSFSTKT
jgi:hypothetical protein